MVTANGKKWYVQKIIKLYGTWQEVITFTKHNKYE